MQCFEAQGNRLAASTSYQIPATSHQLATRHLRLTQRHKAHYDDPHDYGNGEFRVGNKHAQKEAVEATVLAILFLSLAKNKLTANKCR